MTKQLRVFVYIANEDGPADHAVAAPLWRLLGPPLAHRPLNVLSELLFVEAGRRHAETLPDGQTGGLAGLREPYVARALALLRRDIARRWTVDGREAVLSRSALADRFIRLIGVPPMHYLANGRMQVAADRLRNTSASLAQFDDPHRTGRPAQTARNLLRAIRRRRGWLDLLWA